MSNRHLIIDILEARIREQLTPVDMEESYIQMLNDVHGEFMGMDASYILKERDPVAYRCGMNDYVDGCDVTEVGTELYNDDELDALKDELEAQLDWYIDQLGDEDCDPSDLLDGKGRLEEFGVACEPNVWVPEALSALKRHAF